MAAISAQGPRVTAVDVVFELEDRRRELRRVRLVQELARPRAGPDFERRGRRFVLLLPRPPVDRVEYLLELTRRDGTTETVCDPLNPLRAPGPFGERSVVELPEYRPPEWVGDDESSPGDLRPLPVRSRLGPLDALLWSAAETDPTEPLPLLVVHDGPEYAELSALTRFLDHAVAFGELPPLRAALLPPPGERNDTYSASAVYARAFERDLLPALLDVAPTDDRPAGMGASLGALALLHVHWTRPGLLAGLFLQSGSYFRRRTDPQERGFPRFHRIQRFVGRVLGGRATPPAVPATLTCGTGEENRDNNRTLAGALALHGFDVALIEHRDAHNWISWRDVFHPHLPELLLRAWT